jgi:glycosyltransferase involved in cell wall biosynthesis
MPKLTVIIPTFNRKETLRQTLMSFGEQTSGDFDLIVADDGSTDGTAEMVKSLKVPYPIVHLWQPNSGRSAARNMGIKNAEGGIILFVDDHIIVQKDLITEHLRSHEKCSGTNVSVIRGRVEFFGKREDAPDPAKEIIKRETRPSFSDQDPFRNFITNNISVRADALLKVEGFDEDFKEYGLQDSELGYRLRKAGFGFRTNPNAVGYIFSVGLTFQERCSRRRQVGRSSVLFYKKHRNLRIKLTLSTHFLSRIILRILSLGNGRIIKWAEGILKNRDSAFVKRIILLYNFLRGMDEGFEKYKDRRFERFRSSLHRTKVLMVSHNFRFEGAPISLYMLAKNLDRSRYELLFVSPADGPLTGALKDKGIEYKILGGFPFSYQRKVTNIIYENNIDLVHINTLDPIWAINAAHQTRTPAVWHIREAPDFYNSNKIHKLLDKVNLCVCVSDWVRRSFELTNEKARVVYNGVDLSAFAPGLDTGNLMAEFGISEKDVVVGLIGSISKRKGSDIFARAAQIVSKNGKDIRFVIVGDFIPGEFFRLGFNKLLKKLNLGCALILTGPRKDAAKIMSSMDMIVNCSLSEPSGRTIIEGMALEKPIIGSSVGGIPEVIDDGKTGILIPPNDPASLAAAVMKLAADPALRRSMGTAGREKARKLFTIENHVKEIEKIYDEIIRTNRE